MQEEQLGTLGKYARKVAMKQAKGMKKNSLDLGNKTWKRVARNPAKGRLEM